jgi:uncharacterized membrane protein
LTNQPSLVDGLLSSVGAFLVLFGVVALGCILIIAVAWYLLEYSERIFKRHG